MQTLSRIPHESDKTSLPSLCLWYRAGTGVNSVQAVLLQRKSSANENTCRASRVIRSCADVLYSCHTQHATPCGSAGPGPADRSSETFTNPFLMSHVQYTTWSCHPNQPRQRGRCVAVARGRASKSEWGRERERSGRDENGVEGMG